MGPMSLDELRMVKGEMLRCEREAQRDMHPLEVAGVLISLYREASLEIERRALSYALVLLLERSARKGCGVVMAKQQQRAAISPLFLSIPEVAESLRLSRAKVYRLIYYEGLPVVHFGRAARVSVVALHEWVKRHEQGA